MLCVRGGMRWAVVAAVTLVVRYVAIRDADGEGTVDGIDALFRLSDTVRPTNDASTNSNQPR